MFDVKSGLTPRLSSAVRRFGPGGLGEDVLDHQRVDVDERCLQEMQRQDGEFLLVALVAAPSSGRRWSVAVRNRNDLHGAGVAGQLRDSCRAGGAGGVGADGACSGGEEEALAAGRPGHWPVDRLDGV